MTAPRALAFALALASCGPAPGGGGSATTAASTGEGESTGESGTTCDGCGGACGECPSVCDDDGVCEIGERCDECPECGACEVGAPCARLGAAEDGATVVISGEMGDDREGVGLGCDVHPIGVGVTVTGSWRGDLRCHHCDGWIFDRVSVEAGSLRMIAGDGWLLRESVVDGGGRGIMAVVGTGADDLPNGQATRWRMERITARNAGCRPPDDPYPTHARALYIIGKNGVPNDGVIEGSTFEGEGCAATVKIGGTGNFGSWSGAADAADAVVFRGNVIQNLGDGAQQVALLLATNSDEVTVEDNTLVAGEYAINASGPWSGLGLEVRGNVIAAPNFLLARLWNNPAAGAAAPLYGEKYVTFVDPGPCPEVGLCEDNLRR